MKIVKCFFDVILILILLIHVPIALADTSYWEEVARSINGIQFIDINSIETLTKNKISLTSKYQSLQGLGKTNGNPIIYSMEIDCSKNNYRDIDIDGKKQKDNNWQKPKDDILLNETIKKACLI